MNILTLGATGNTGQHFVKFALERGHKVRALVRSSAVLDKRPGLEVVKGDVLDPAALAQAAREMEAIVCCLGIRKQDPADPWSLLLSPEDFMERCAIGIVDAMKASGLQRVVVISSAGVGDSWGSVDPDLRHVIQSSSVGKIFRDLGNMERVLEASGLDTLAVRPVALVSGDTSGTARIVDTFEKTSRIPQPWRNRFAQSAREKVDLSFRHRARMQASNALVIFMPIKGPLSSARIEILCDQDPILLNGTTVAGRIDDATIPNDGQWFKQFYFHAVATETVTVTAGGRAYVPIALRWNGDGVPCSHELALKLESDAGYLPKRRLNTDASGVGSFAVEALGLSPGDQIAVKINTEHYTAIGKIILEVV